MSSKAEKRALEAYPQVWNEEEDCDVNYDGRCGFIEGYEQAEKDFGWHSIDECLPETDEEVIVLTDELGINNIYKISFGHIVDRKYAMDYNGWNIPGVKFWMPCPKIPNQDE